MLIRKFLGFTFVSGVGWLCDLLIFVTLLHTFGISPSASNLISSYAGLTFVYFTSARFVFLKTDRRATFLLAYWTYQALSILTYSLLIGWLAHWLSNQQVLRPVQLGLAAKILATPASLCTNFAFMKLLTDRMRDVYRTSIFPQSSTLDSE
jgi:putative flippase GtrA